ncbi:MAG TPA: alpha/beta hydrolase-fold protein [Dongiaceae bacterium]|nr:alpha/beta hydrolase-fold protein [Dongiaceae bacterium]
MIRTLLPVFAASLVFVLMCAQIGAQPGAPSGQGAVKKGTLQRIKVHGQLLEGNLDGDSPDRDVTVYLPPSYAASPDRRYPVLYMLHGFTDNDAKWMGLTKHWISLSSLMDQGIAAGTCAEMIVVMPNAFTRFHGSLYSSSVVTGDWEGFISSELVAYVDGHYRSIAGRNSRGIAGHSMGGYGALRIGMKHPEVFSAVYLLSPWSMAAPTEKSTFAMAKAAAKISDPAKIDGSSFETRSMFASAAAWSPNPENPPFFVDLPVKDGKWQPEVAQKWAANAPLVTVYQYMDNLKSLTALAFDAGDNDPPITSEARDLDTILSAYKIPHAFEIYPGDHVNHIAERVTKKVLPFFSKHLATQ